jgi:PAS domain S-box-containing protein
MKTRLSQISESLQKSEERYRNLIENAKELIQSVAPDGRFLFVNKAWRDTLGYTAEDLPKLTVFDVLHPDSLLHCREIFSKTLNGESVQNLEAVFVAKNGSRILVEGNAVPRIEGGKVIATHGFFLDCTDHKRAEGDLIRSEIQYRALIEQASDAIFVADANLRFIEVNASACELSGHTKDETLAMTIPDLMFPEDLIAEPLHVKELREGKTVVSERRFKKKNGESVQVELSSKILPDGRLQSIARDITERKRTQALMDGEKKVLEMLATGASLLEILETVSRNIEAQAGDALCSILLLDPDGVHLRHGAAPSLPEAYSHAIDGAAIGPSAGSCGTAAYLRKQVIVADIATDPLWADYRDLALSHGLRACWSTPIHASNGRIVGTFAMYYREPRSPQATDLELIERTTHLAAVAIERKLAEELLRDSEQRMRLATEATEVGIWEWNITTNRIRWDPQMFRIYGIAPTKDGFVQYSDWSGSVLREELSRQEDLLQVTVRRLGRGVREFHIRRRDDRECRFIQAVEIVRTNAQGQAEWVVGTNLDITERTRSEEALKKAHDELETKVLERTAELEVATEQALAADSLKSAFLATMSHELRTPLNSIIGFTGIILQGLAGPLNPEQTKQLEMVRGSARHLLALINDVLDISKIEAGQLEVYCEPFDLRASITNVTNTVRPLAEKKGLVLNVEVALAVAEVVSDKRRVEQVLLNLLSNAVKFTEKGRVTLRAAVASDSAARSVVRMSVTDTGMGIKSEDLDKLFRPFRQIDSELSRNHEGTGLGLAICKKLAEKLGGAIRAESEWGKGSEFTFTLPVAGGK